METPSSALMNPSAWRSTSVLSALLMWCGLAVVSSLYVIVPVASLVATSYHTDLTHAAWTQSAFTICYAIGFLVVGPLSERYGKRNVILTGLVLLAGVSPLIGAAPTLWSAVLLRGVQGAAAATFAPTAMSYVMETYPAAQRTTAIGWISTGFLTAGIAGQVYSSMVSGRYGWSSIFIGLGMVYLLTALLVLLLVPADRPKRTPIRWSAIPRELSILLVRPALLPLYAATVTVLFAFVGMYLSMGAFLSAEPFRLTTDDILYVRAAGILGMMVSPFTGALSARFGSSRILLTGFILGFIGLAGILAIRQVPPAVLFSILFVTGVSLIVPTLIAVIGQLSGPSRGWAVSLYSFVLFVGATLSSILLPPLLVSGGTYTALVLLLAVWAVGLAAASVHCHRSRRPL